MGNDLIVGIRLGVVGMSLTFLALGLLILVMVLLLRLFPEKSGNGPKEPAVNAKDTGDLDEQRLEELAVALAVGICLLEHNNTLEHHDPSLGKLLEQ